MLSSLISTTLIFFCMLLKLFCSSCTILLCFCRIYSLLSLFVNILYIFFGSFKHIILVILCKLCYCITRIYIRQHPVYIFVLLICVYDLCDTLIKLTLRTIFSSSSSVLFWLVFITKFLL
mgnify:FL=1|jgi:hypothetical protein